MAFDIVSYIHSSVPIFGVENYLRNLNDMYRNAHVCKYHSKCSQNRAIRIEYQYDQHSLIINSILFGKKQYCNLFSEVSCVQMAFMQQCFIQLYMHRTLSSGIFEMFVCFNLMLAMDHTEFCTLFASYRYQQRGARNSIRMLKVISHIP